MGGLPEIHAAGRVCEDEVGRALCGAAEKRGSAGERHHAGMDRGAPLGGPSPGAAGRADQRERDGEYQKCELRFLASSTTPPSIGLPVQPDERL